MKRFVIVLAVAAVCSSANAELILQVPNRTLCATVSPCEFNIDLGFLVGPPNVGQELVGYRLTLKLTRIGGSGFGITGAGTEPDLPADSVFATQPAYTVHADSDDCELYTFEDFLASGTAMITDGSSLLRVKTRVEPDARGVYIIGVFSDSSSDLGSRLYSGFDEQGDPIPIADVVFQSAVVFIIPEPPTVALAASGLLAIGLLAFYHRARAHRGQLAGNYGSIARNSSNR